MANKLVISTLFCFLFSLSIFAQKKNKTTKEKIIKQDSLVTVTVQDSIKMQKKAKRMSRYNVLSPSKAAFYSAILPGLGQAYNRKYWKIPVVYAAIGTAIYFYTDNNTAYKRYRNAYKRRLAGFTDDEFFGYIENDGLIQAQKTLKRNKELSMLLTVGAYVLNIIDANVDAHLMLYNVSDDLSLNPHYEFNQYDNSNAFGLSLNYNF